MYTQACVILGGFQNVQKADEHDRDSETLVLFRGGVGEERVLSYVCACFQMGLAFQLARSFFPYGVDLSEACQLSRELTTLIGLKKKTNQNWFLGLINPESEPCMYQKMVNHKMKVKASLKKRALSHYTSVRLNQYVWSADPLLTISPLAGAEVTPEAEPEHFLLKSSHLGSIHCQWPL